MKLIFCEQDVVAARVIPVEFVVLHYTAENLEETLRLFGGGASAAVSTHLVISPDGVVHELLPCWEGSALRGAHAGASRWTEGDGNREWKGFNDFSIGIEIVHWNGNVFPYPDAQYDAIVQSLLHLKSLYPALEDPKRIVGHEQIAGWRGKVDPGARFDWTRLFREAYPGIEPPVRRPACPPELLDRLSHLVPGEPDGEEEKAQFWRAVNYFLEKSAAVLNSAELE